MKANELRIGNWVADILGEIMKVEQLGHKDNPDYIFARNEKGFGQNGFYGITLTPDILEKAGFKEVEGNDYYRFFDYGYLRVFISINDKSVFSDWMNVTLDNTINNLPLHTLQNIVYFLTGEELTINL